MDEFLNQSLELILITFSWIKTNWDTTAISTVVLAFLTAILARDTKVLASEARKTREQSIEPNIVITIEPYEQASFYGYLVIENIGSGAAYDVEIREKSNFHFKDDDREFNMNDIALMNQKILKSGQKIKHLLGRFGDFPSQVYTFEIVAKDATGKTITCSNMVDIKSYIGLVNFESKDMDSLVRLVEKIEKNFSHIISGFNRLNVNIFDSENRTEETEKRRKEIEERRKTQD